MVLGGPLPSQSSCDSKKSLTVFQRDRNSSHTTDTHHLEVYYPIIVRMQECEDTYSTLPLSIYSGTSAKLLTHH